MNSPFKVTCDECAITLHFTEGRFGVAMDLTPNAARLLGYELIEKAQLCEDAQEHEVEQMRG
jgi:hypothetical protein